MVIRLFLVTRRLHELDALRGFAVCGIMVVNTWQHTRDHLKSPEQNAVDWAVDNLLQSRFYPIFSFLFGLSFVLFLRSAAQRTDHPWAALLRRLAVLAALGAVHQVVNPGEVLLPYAIFGALVLLPVSFLPRPRWRSSEAPSRSGRCTREAGSSSSPGCSCSA
ncbi:heparan-alpha-glucosaminide N-acetyltransferase domain-containing protein [Streptosporangium lutulentum]